MSTHLCVNMHNINEWTHMILILFYYCKCPEINLMRLNFGIKLQMQFYENIIFYNIYILIKIKIGLILLRNLKY